jgi:hypothetical protein
MVYTGQRDIVDFISLETIGNNLQRLWTNRVFCFRTWTTLAENLGALSED